MSDMAGRMAATMSRRIELSDVEIIAALREMPGYIDVTVGDLVEIFRRAYPLAVHRSLGALCARDLMTTGVQAVPEDAALIDVVRSLVEQGVRSLPVVGREGQVLGVIAEADLLCRLEAGSALQLLLQVAADPGALDRAALGLPVSQAMSSRAVTVDEDARYAAIAAAFDEHAGDGLPVVDADGRLLGVLSRTEVAAAAHGLSA